MYLQTRIKKLENIESRLILEREMPKYKLFIPVMLGNDSDEKVAQEEKAEATKKAKERYEELNGKIEHEKDIGYLFVRLAQDKD